MPRKRASVKAQIEKTFPTTTENSWYKKPGKPLSEAAAKRSKKHVWSRYPKHGETTFVHTHVDKGSLPGPEDIISAIKMTPHGVTKTVIATSDGKKLHGYTFIKHNKKSQFEKMYNYMQKIMAEKKPRTIQEKKNYSKRIRSALTRYGFNVRFLSMPRFSRESTWKKRRKKRPVKA